MLKQSLLIIISIFISFTSYAGKPNSSKNITITVVGTDGEALVGVAVQIKGSDKVLYTDFDGNIEIPSEEKTTIVLNYLLHETIIVTLNAGEKPVIVLPGTN